MRHPFQIFVAGSLLVTSLAGCSPVALQAALDAAKAADAKGAASPGPGASPAGTATPAPGGTTAPAPGGTTAPTAGAGASMDADIAAVAKAFAAAVDAASQQDPEMVARLFVTAMVAYDVNKALGRAMMGYALRSNLVSATPTSPTGFEPQAADEIYFRTFDRDTKLGRYYLDKPESGEKVFNEAVAHVAIDKEYKAVDQGLSADGKMWTFYIKVNHPNNVRSRPLRLQKDGDKGWRISNYSSLMVQP